MADMKEYKIKIDVKGDKDVDKLKDNLDKVDVKVHDMSASASDVLSACKSDLQEVMEYIVLQMSKIGAIVTELNTHLGQAIEKNKGAGEKLVQDMEKAGESSMSAIKIKAIEASAQIEAWINKVGSRTDEQSAKLAKQVEENKKLLDKSIEEINKKYDKEDIGIFNLKAHKENIDAHIAEVKKYKNELEAATLHTRLQYDAMSLHYDKDSEEFKKVQEDKKKALEELQKKMEEIDKGFKESSNSYLDVWKNQHKEIKTKMDDFTKDDGTFQKAIEKYSYGFKEFSKNFDESMTELKNGISKSEKAEKEINTKKYEKKIGELDKELEKIREEAIKNEKEKKRLEDEQAEAKKKAEKYRADIKEIEEAFEIKDTLSKEENGNIPANEEAKTNAPADNLTDESSKKEGDKDKVNPPSDEEMDAAKKRIAELEGLAATEESIVTNKQTAIEEANNRIIESNRSVLLEQMRIKDEKVKLQEEQAKKEAEIAEKAKKNKERLEKLEKIKAKAQFIYDKAVAIKDIAKGVTKAWALGPIIGPPMAALVAINGAIQVGIMTQQLKYMQDGGLLRGKRHAQGGMRIEGTNIEVEGGEYVVNRISTGKNIDLIRYINSQRRELAPTDISAFFAKSSQGFEPPFSRAFESGGQLPAIESPNTVDNEYIVEAIRSIRIEPRVAVTDINRVQNEMVSVDNWVGL